MTSNDEWNLLVKKLNMFDRTINPVKFFRTRCVQEASEWMAGRHGSLQNHKELFGYTDSEWTYIWSTLIEDGAWNVPSILDH